MSKCYLSVRTVRLNIIVAESDLKNGKYIWLCRTIIYKEENR